MKVRVRTRPGVIPLPEEFEALLWVLNATGEQVKQWASSLPPEEGYDRDFDGWGGISLLLQDPEWEGSKEQIATSQAGIAGVDDEKGHPGGSTVGVPVPELPMAPAGI